MRNVTIYTSTGERKYQISSDACNWGELKSEIKAKLFDVVGVKPIIGETRVALGFSNDRIPESDFTLFLIPENINPKKDIYNTDINFTRKSNDDNIFEGTSDKPIEVILKFKDDFEATYDRNTDNKFKFKQVERILTSETKICYFQKQKNYV